jgi:hypothetical protein
MAGYFTQFSCLFDVGTPENARRALELFDTFSERLDAEEAASPGFAVSVHPDDGGTALWIHDDGCGDTNHVAAYVAECALALGLKGKWGFEWAHTCGKPRLDGFGGGALIVDLETRDTSAWVGTGEWLHRQLAVNTDGSE